jgi:hypothetical protein
LDEGWDLIRQGIKTDVPHDVGLYLGCIHRVSERVLPATVVKVRVTEYDMEDFLVSCVERYKESTGVTALKSVATPFLHEPTEPEFPGLKEEEAHATCLLAGSVSVPGGDLGKTKRKAETRTVEPYAAKILMKILYAARMARFDLLRAVCGLGQLIT